MKWSVCRRRCKCTAFCSSRRLWGLRMLLMLLLKTHTHSLTNHHRVLRVGKWGEWKGTHSDGTEAQAQAETGTDWRTHHHNTAPVCRGGKQTATAATHPLPLKKKKLCVGNCLFSLSLLLICRRIRGLKEGKRSCVREEEEEEEEFESSKRGHALLRWEVVNGRIFWLIWFFCFAVTLFD